MAWRQRMARRRMVWRLARLLGLWRLVGRDCGRWQPMVGLAVGVDRSVLGLPDRDPIGVDDRPHHIRGTTAAGGAARGAFGAPERSGRHMVLLLEPARVFPVRSELHEAVDACHSGRNATIARGTAAGLMAKGERSAPS
jgi:hypothetical protein